MSLEQVEYVLRYGTKVYRTGVVFYVLRRKDIPAVDLRLDKWARLEGTVVLVDEASILTVYRNRKALRQIRKKSEYKRLRAA